MTHSQMLQYVIALFCILWFVRVWIVVFGWPFRLCLRVLLSFLHSIQACYAKTADIAKYARIERQKTA